MVIDSIPSGLHWHETQLPWQSHDVFCLQFCAVIQIYTSLAQHKTVLLKGSSKMKHATGIALNKLLKYKKDVAFCCSLFQKPCWDSFSSSPDKEFRRQRQPFFMMADWAQRVHQPTQSLRNFWEIKTTCHAIRLTENFWRIWEALNHADIREDEQSYE